MSNNNRNTRSSSTKYGICTNMEPKQDGTMCSLCQKKEKQAIRSTKDFVCAECGAPLTEVTPPRPFPTKILISILSIILLVAAVVIGIVRQREDGETVPDDSISSGNSETIVNYNVTLSIDKDALTLDVGTSETLKAMVTTIPDNLNATFSVSFTSDNIDVAQVDNAGVVRAVAEGETTITVVAWSPEGGADTAKVRVTVNDIVLPDQNPKPSDDNQGSSKRGSSKISFGTLDGSISYDNNATIKVTKQHTIQLKDAKRSTITLYFGDELRQCRIRKGVLESFQIIRQNGNRQSIIDSYEKLN